MIDTGQHIDVESSPDPDSRDPVILLLIQNSQDRRLFKKNLPNRFVIRTGEQNLEPENFDLCIVDDKTSQLHRKYLESLKTQAKPVILPVLLLSQNQDVLKKNPGILDFADDVIYIPTSTNLLQSRINLLLKQRRYSLDLEKANRQLEAEKEFIDKAIQSLPEIFYMVDQDQNFIKWTNIKRELGYSDKEVEQMHPLDFYQEEDHEFITSQIKKAFEKGSAKAEVQMKTKSGELIPYFVTTKQFTRGGEQFLVGTCINLTEIKEAEYDLEQQRQLLDAIINQTDAVIYVKDQNRKIRLVNESYLKLFGLKREEIIGKTDLEIHGQKLDAEIKNNDLRVLEKGKTIEVEEKIPVGDRYEFYHTIKYPLEGVPGFENCLCGISTNITDLKLASAQLKERIKEQQCLYKISSLPEEASSVDELLGKAVTCLPDGWQFPEITEATIRFGDKVYRTEGYRDTEWRLSESNRIEDKLLKVDVVYKEQKKNFEHGAFLKEERQLIDSIVETISSQIERLYVSERLKESEKRWGDLVKNDPNLIQILEPDGTIQFINESGATILGFGDPEKAIGENYFDLVALEDDEAELSEERAKKVLEGNIIGSHTYKIRDSNGKILYLESQAVPTNLDDGRRGIQQVAKDVTDREQYERQLKESLKEKKTLLQEIHHRVKNNLAVVSGMMELQTFNTTNEEVRQLMADSKNRIKTMALIHEKLYQSESLSEIEFGSYVEDLLHHIRHVSSVSDDIELNLECDSFNLNVNQAVPSALIINEMVSNAYEHAFSDCENGQIDVFIQQREDKVFVKVQDNGRGLPDDYMDRKKDSIGFTIANTLIQQLQAEKNIDNQDGLEFSFSFKKQNISGSSSTLV